MPGICRTPASPSTARWDFLERLLRAAESGGRIGSAIEILALNSLAFEAAGDLPRALESLDRAIALAEPEGYVRIFVDEGPRMAELLARLPLARTSGTRGMETYVRAVLAAFGRSGPSRTMKATLSPKPGIAPEASPRRPLQQGLHEPLSRRELEVLGLIGQGLSNKEIGERLFLALDTIKGHNRRIFDKLDVKRRTEALAPRPRTGSPVGLSPGIVARNRRADTRVWFGVDFHPARKSALPCLREAERASLCLGMKIQPYEGEPA